MDYFDAYLRYWELYHLYVATTGLSANRDLRVVIYGQQRFENLAAGFHRRYDSTATPGRFVVDDQLRNRHPDWVKRAQPAIERVAAVWQGVGIPFPTAELMEAW